MYINKSNEVSFNEVKGALYNAVSGDRMLVEKGKRIETLESQSVEPRSAAGINQNGRWLFLAVIDGRQPGYSAGRAIYFEFTHRRQPARQRIGCFESPRILGE